MLEKIKTYAIAHILGLILLIAGWYIAIIDAALDRFSQKSIISSATIIGLVLIIIGAYLPEVWVSIVKKKKQK